MKRSRSFCAFACKFRPGSSSRITRRPALAYSENAAKNEKNQMKPFDLSAIFKVTRCFVLRTRICSQGSVAPAPYCGVGRNSMSSSTSKPSFCVQYSNSSSVNEFAAASSAAFRASYSASVNSSPSTPASRSRARAVRSPAPNSASGVV